MVIDFGILKASDYAAWWGAIIATLALIWNIVVALKAGARVELSVMPNMELHPPHPGQEGKTFIFVKAVNKGNASTTITHFCGYKAESYWGRFRKKIKPFVVGSNGSYVSPPIKLNPGEEWTGIVEQHDMIVSSPLLYLGIYHNQRDKPIYKKVKIGT